MLNKIIGKDPNQKFLKCSKIAHKADKMSKDSHMCLETKWQPEFLQEQIRNPNKTDLHLLQILNRLGHHLLFLIDLLLIILQLFKIDSLLIHLQVEDLLNQIIIMNNKGKSLHLLIYNKRNKLHNNLNGNKESHKDLNLFLDLLHHKKPQEDNLLRKEKILHKELNHQDIEKLLERSRNLYLDLLLRLDLHLLIITSKNPLMKDLL